MVGGDLQRRDVAREPAGIDPGIPVERRLQQDRRIDEPLHEDVGVPRADEAHGLGGGGLGRLGLYALETGEVQPELGREGVYRGEIADEHGVG